MKVIPFRKYSAPLSNHIHDPVDLFCHLLTGEKQKIFCFLDESNLCQKYWIENPWIEELCDKVIVTTQSIIDSFEVTKVPMFTFYSGEYEIHTIIGTASHESVLNAQKRCAEVAP